MDALADYGSDDSSSTSDTKPTTPTATTAIEKNVDGNDNDDDNEDNGAAADKNKAGIANVSLNESRKRKNAMPSLHFLPGILDASECLVSFTNTQLEDGSCDRNCLALLHQRVQQSLAALDNSTDDDDDKNNNAADLDRFLPPASDIAGASSFLESMDSIQSHEFRNPMFMEQIIKELNIQDALDTTLELEPVLDWETNLLQLEERARVQQQQEQQHREAPNSYM